MRWTVQLRVIIGLAVVTACSDSFESNVSGAYRLVGVGLVEGGVPAPPPVPVSNFLIIDSATMRIESDGQARSDTYGDNRVIVREGHWLRRGGDMFLEFYDDETRVTFRGDTLVEHTVNSQTGRVRPYFWLPR